MIRKLILAVATALLSTSVFSQVPMTLPTGATAGQVPVFNSTGTNTVPSSSIPGVTGVMGNAINITAAAYGAKGDMIIATRTVSITSGQNTLTATGASFSAGDVGKMISVGAAGTTPTMTSVAITGTAGQFSCTCTALAVNQPVTISGTYGGTGSITGYANPTTYFVSATNGTSTFTLVAGGNGGTALVTTAGTPTGLTYTVQTQPLITTISGYTSSTQVTLTANAGTTVTTTSEKVAYGTDNAAALNAAIVAAANGVMFVPSVGVLCFGFTPPLTNAANLTIVGDVAGANFGESIDIPTNLYGSVLCPASNGSDFMDTTVTGVQVNLKNIGVSWQTPFVNTGHGFFYQPALTSGNYQGLSAMAWENTLFLGVDGNHYALYAVNPIYGNAYGFYSWGGGGIYLDGNSAGDYGNLTFWYPQVQYCTGGIADAFHLDATSASYLNLISFHHVQSSVENSGCTGGVTPAAQNIFYVGPNVTAINFNTTDLETNVSGILTLNGGGSSHNNYDWGHMFQDAAAINISGGVGSYGLMLPAPPGLTFNDSTSSGTVALWIENMMQAPHLTASSATTYTVAATLMCAPPIASTNVTITRNDCLYGTGEIYTTGDLGSNGGLFVGGTAQFNGNSALIKIGNNLWASTTAPTVTSGLGHRPRCRLPTRQVSRSRPAAAGRLRLQWCLECLRQRTGGPARRRTSRRSRTRTTKAPTRRLR